MINILRGIWLQVIYEWSQIIIKFYIKAYSFGEQISTSFPFPKESMIAQTVSPSHAHLPGCSFLPLCFTTQTPSVWGPESCHSSQHCWENPVERTHRHSNSADVSGLGWAERHGRKPLSQGHHHQLLSFVSLYLHSPLTTVPLLLHLPCEGQLVCLSVFTRLRNPSSLREALCSSL